MKSFHVELMYILWCSYFQVVARVGAETLSCFSLRFYQPGVAEGGPDNFLSQFIQQINYTEPISILDCDQYP